MKSRVFIIDGIDLNSVKEVFFVVACKVRTIFAKRNIYIFGILIIASLLGADAELLLPIEVEWHLSEHILDIFIVGNRPAGIKNVRQDANPDSP